MEKVTKIASPGKFRLVVLIDSEFYQIGEDHDSFEKALESCKENWTVENFAAIYDDRGRAVDPRLYQGGFYKVWTDEEMKTLGDQAIGELQGLQKSFIRQGVGITADQLGMILQMAEAELARIKKND